MARLNIYLPDELYNLADKWRGKINLSEVCARALREELGAIESYRGIYGLLDNLRTPSPLEKALARRYGLVDVLVCEADEGSDIREALGGIAARYLDSHLCDGSLLAIGGGRQMWCVVRNLLPRRVRTVLTALGIRQNDPQVLHAHANTLITILWLLYSPRSEAHLIGTTAFHTIWSDNLPHADHPKYFVAASCGHFDRNTPFAQLIGAEASDELLRNAICGDYAYLFFNNKGQIIESLKTECRSILTAPKLQELSRRSDARVLLVAGGEEKRRIVHFALEAGLCNVLITDTLNANYLLDIYGEHK